MVEFETLSERKPNIFEEDMIDEVSSNNMNFKVSTSEMRDEFKGLMQYLLN